MTEITVSQLLSSLTHLVSKKSGLSRLDAEVLMAHALGWERSKLYASGDYILSQTEQDNIAELINRRLKGEPVAYITGSQEFWSLPLIVTPATLIPRPETEHLVEEALKVIPENEVVQVADLGTGSGAIALAIAKERPNSLVSAIDQSSEAIAVAKKNQIALNINNVEFLKSHWFEKLENKLFDVIVSNPPYIAENDAHLKQGDVVFEPESALSSGKEGLDDIQVILTDAQQFLSQDGWVFLEHGYQQSDQVQEIMRSLHYKSITTVNDLAGHERITFAQK